MKLSLLRYSSTLHYNGSTMGLLFVDGQFECYTLEDEARDIKVMHETCIPIGTYKISLADWGMMNEKYAKRYGSSHIGMLLLENVPKFDGILIHCGNTEAHSSGCILVGDRINNNAQSPAFIDYSDQAYRRVYNRVVEQLLQSKTVVIEVRELLQGVSE